MLAGGLRVPKPSPTPLLEICARKSPPTAPVAHRGSQKPAEGSGRQTPKEQRSRTLTQPPTVGPRLAALRAANEGLCRQPGHLPGKQQAVPPRLTHSTQRVSWHWAAPSRPPHPDVLAEPRSSLPGKTQDAQITRACRYGVPSRCVLRGVWDTFRLRKCLCDTVGKGSALRVLSGDKKVEEVSPLSEHPRGTPPDQSRPDGANPGPRSAPERGAPSLSKQLRGAGGQAALPGPWATAPESPCTDRERTVLRRGVLSGSLWSHLRCSEGDQRMWGRPGPRQVHRQTGLKAKRQSPHSKGAQDLGGSPAQATSPVPGRQCPGATARHPAWPSLVSLQERVPLF